MSRWFKGIGWTVAGLAALFLTMWVVWSRFEQTPKRYLDSAEQKWRADDFLGAVRDYERITEEYSNSRWAPEAHYWTGVIYFLYLNEPQKAIHSFQKTIQSVDPSGSARALDARRYLAEIYEKKLNMPKKAITEHERIMQESLDSDLAMESRYKVGELYFAQGDLEQARTEWDLLIKKDPKSRWAPAALYRQGSTFFVTGHCREAMALYRRLFTDYPEHEMSHFAKFQTASCLEESQLPAEALRLYRELEGHYPNEELLAGKIKQLEKRQPPVKQESGGAT